MKMFEHFLTVGLFDKESEKQEIETQTAKDLITDILIKRFNIYNFTLVDVCGVYKMQRTNAIIKEPSIRVEIATELDSEITKEIIYKIIKDFKRQLNQESIMYKMIESEIDFI